jgi:hypothetical protein
MKLVEHAAGRPDPLQGLKASTGFVVRLGMAQVFGSSAPNRIITMTQLYTILPARNAARAGSVLVRATLFLSRRGIRT